MLTIARIAKRFGSRTLFEDVSLQINSGERIALVGPNGAGKSTLFSIILGEQEADEGSVTLDRYATRGHLPQETSVQGDETVLGIATAISPEHERYRRILDEGERSGQTDTEVFQEAQARYGELGGFQLDPPAKRILKGLAFRESDFLRPAKTLSGGWVMRAHLARLLVLEPDLLMLDEPTNHLDLESLGWFQNYLAHYPGAVLMISHDRAFLDSLVESIWEIGGGHVNPYRGNYASYLEQKQARIEQQWAAYKNQQGEIQKLQEFADRFRAKASKASQAQSKLKQIERMEKIQAPEDRDKKIKIKFPQPVKSGQRVLTFKDVRHAYGDLVVYRGLDLEIERGQRTVLVGPNGAGKSTLLKIAGGVLPVQGGERVPGFNTHIGYYSQNRIEMLNPTRTVLQEVMSIPKPVPEVNARTVLGSFLFTGDAAFKPVSVLSGGEKSRLALIKLLLDPPNLLLMDEPTTHLDMASIDALIEALRQYEGTLVFISHDVYFIRALAQTVWQISAGELTPYSGDYDYFLEKSGALSARAGLIAGEKLATAPLRDGRPDATNGATKNGQGGSGKSKEQKRREAEERQQAAFERKQSQQRVKKIEAEIALLESQQKELTARLEDPGLYQKGGDVMQLNRALVEAGEKLAALAREWEQAGQAAEVSAS